MNEKLREALAIVEKYGMKGDVIYKEIEALAASKQEPQLLQKSFDELVAERRASKQEPQAQAEPEVVAEIHSDTLRWRVSDDHKIHECGHAYLITLQSHREAMAGWNVTKRRLESQAYHAEQDAQKLRAHCVDYREAISKKDAALKVCVEALGTCRIMSKDNDGNYTIEATPKIITSAIKQAKDSLE